MRANRVLMSSAAAWVLLGWALAVAWGQGGASPGLPGASSPQPSALAEQSPEEEYAGGWPGFVHEHFPLIHKLGQAGVAGMVLNLLVAVLVFLVLGIKGAARAAWRHGHMRVGLVFGIAAMAHGTAIDLKHLAGGEAGEVLNSGSWLCTMTFLIVLTGLLRMYGRQSPQVWRWAHRVAVVAWIGLLCWHVIPKIV